MEFEKRPISWRPSDRGPDLMNWSSARSCWWTMFALSATKMKRPGINLEGLFIRLGHAVATIKAKRVVLDSVESLFAGLSDAAVLRAELRRLFHWLDDHNLTAIVTAERGNGTLTRHGLEEYLADCVILLDHRVNEQISTRRLRIVKYRGTAHGTVEYPYMIDADGLSVLPITSLALTHKASNERVSRVSGLTRCWAEKDSSGAAACWYRARREPGSPALRRNSPAPPAPAAKPACISLLKSLPTRLSATCARWA
jgi:hypothetical protein